MLAAWRIGITCTGAALDGTSPKPGDWTTCTPTVLCRDTGDPAQHLAHRGACLGCGWISDAEHRIGDGGENLAAEDANDHTHPAWRTLPVVANPPPGASTAPERRALAAWRARWEPILPPGWLDAGGPIRTRRDGNGTRHVPERCPGGGYDMAAPDDDVEDLGGQLALDLFAV